VIVFNYKDKECINKQKGKTMIYSNSRIGTYESCPLKFKYQYIDRIKSEEEFETVEAFLGIRVHEVMEKLYKNVRMQKDFTLDDLLAYYNRVWGKNWSEDVHIIKKDLTAENYKKIGIKAINDYYARYKPFDNERILGIERKIRIDLKDDKSYKVQGVIDRLSETKDGFYEVHDYKTSGWLPAREKFETDRQLALYQLGVQKEFDDVKSVDLIWHYMAFDKEFRSKRSKRQLNQLENEVIMIIDDIENAREKDYFPATPSKLCDYCEYQDICPAMKHLVKTQEMPVNEYMKEPGVNLVNKYAKTKEKLSEIKKEMELELGKLEEAIIAYAKKEKLEMIAGTDKKLKVKIEQSVKYPATGDEKRQELEEIIRQAGKWNEVSGLSIPSLNKSLDKWDKKLADKIRKYQKLEESYRLSLSKLEREEEE
jgi:putative RecB family exonuclease